MRRKQLGLFMAILMICILLSSLGLCSVSASETLITENFEGDFKPASGFRYGAAAVEEKSGNHALRLWHFHEDNPIERTLGGYIATKVGNLSEPFAGDYILYRSKVMIPNVAPAGEAVFAGGTPGLAIGSSELPSGGDYGDIFFAASLSANKGSENGSVTVKTSKTVSYTANVKPDTWAELAILLDAKAKTGSVLLNGKLIASGIAYNEAAAIRSFGVGQAPSASTSVPAGYLLGDGSRAEASAKYFGNPYPGYVDDITVMALTAEEADMYISASPERTYTLYEDGFEEEQTWQIQAVATCEVVQGTAHSGNKAFSVTNGRTSPATLKKSLNIPITGERGTFSAYLKASSSATSTGAKLSVEDKTGATVASSDKLIADTGGAWQKLELDFDLCDPYQSPYTFVLSWNAKGTAIWDDIKVDYTLFQDKPVKDLPAVLPGAAELISNPGLETDKNLTFQRGSISSLAQHSGINSARLVWRDGQNMQITVPNLQPFATYRYTAWAFVTDTKTVVYPVMSFYDKNGTQLRNVRFKMENIEKGGWVQTMDTVTAPAKTSYARLGYYVDPGTIAFIDDQSFMQMEEPAYGQLHTDEVFYYTDMTEGKATFTANDAVYPGFSAWNILFKVKKGDAVLESSGTQFSGSTAKFTFDLTKLTDREATYYIEVTVKNGASTLATYKTPIYRKYDRPDRMTKTGATLDENGEPFNPVFGYQAYKQYYPYCKELGINIVPIAVLDDLENTMKNIDYAASFGLYTAVVLFVGEESAGVDLERTRKAVLAARNHPKVWGYVVDDEPVGKSHNYDQLIEAYDMIRELDPTRPTYTCDMYPIYFDEFEKYVDFVGTDCYPYGVARSGYCVGDAIKEAHSLTKDSGKGVMPILQFFERNGYYPTADEMRNMIYQSFFEGATGLGYYALSAKYGGKPVYETAPADGMREFAAKEQDLFFDTFVHGRAPMLAEEKGNDYWYRTFTDGKDYYAAVLNRSVYDSVTAVIPTPFAEADATALVVAGTGADSITSFNGKALSIKLQKAGAALYKITKPSGICFMQNGKEIESLKAGNIDVSYSGLGANIRMYVSVYKNTDGKRKLTDFSVSDGKNVTVSVTDPENEELTVYIWDGLEPIEGPIPLKK